MLRKPTVVFEMMGKIAMMVAQMISAPWVFFTRMMISGAMATIGVTDVYKRQVSVLLSRPLLE